MVACALAGCTAVPNALQTRASPAAASTSRPAPARGPRLVGRALVEELKQLDVGPRDAHGVEQPLVVCLPLRQRSSLLGLDLYDPLVPVLHHAPPGGFGGFGGGATTSVRPYFEVQIDEPPPPQQKDKSADYYANVGDAIRALRDDIPLLFQRELNWSIYREDVTFRDPNISFTGLKNYKLIFWSLRFHGRLFFKNPHVEVLRIWQPEDQLIKMRWKVRAVPRVWWEAEGCFDGLSTYKLDREGKVYEHAVDNVQLRDPPITNPLLYGLNYILSPRLQPQQVPCPGSWFSPGFVDHDAAGGARTHPDALEPHPVADV